MTKKELLKPRYKVIADYPDGIWEVGDIIHDGFKGWQGIAPDYPHLFKPLQWWEERELKDMPEYLTYQFMPDSPLKVKKVDNHFTNSAGNPNRFGFMAQDDFHSYSKTTPATEQEYNDYIKLKVNTP